MVFFKKLKSKIEWIKTTPALLTVVNAFLWYIFSYAVFSEKVDGLNMLYSEELVLYSIYYSSVAISAIIGAKFAPRFRRLLLVLWPFLGVIATMSLTLISQNSIWYNGSIALFFGISIGVGLPSCLSYFADSAPIENRGFAAGIIWSLLGFSILFFAFVYGFGTQVMVIALAIWRVLGGIGFLVFSSKYDTVLRKQEGSSMQKSPSFLELIRKREVLLYLFPWMMFSIINFVEAPILTRVFGDGFVLLQILEYAIVGLIAVVGGYISDIVGRKRVIIAGFVMLGATYAIMSAVFLVSDAEYLMYLFFALDGVTWGLLATVFMTVIWGDLGEDFAKDKYYVLGGLPFLLAGIWSLIVQPFVDFPPWGAFSLASFLLFLAVLPLVFAPETLPAKTMKDKALKSYLEKAQKIKDKYT